jgi:hypothetical protein
VAGFSAQARSSATNATVSDAPAPPVHPSGSGVPSGRRGPVAGTTEGDSVAPPDGDGVSSPGGDCVHAPSSRADASTNRIRRIATLRTLHPGRPASEGPND